MTSRNKSEIYAVLVGNKTSGYEIKYVCNREHSELKRIMYIVRDVVVVVLLFYVHGKYLRSCWDGQLT